MNKIFEKMNQNDIAIYGNIRYCNDFKYVFQLALRMNFSNVFYIQDLQHISCELQKLCEQYRLVIACIDKSVWCRIKDTRPAKVVWMEELFELLDEMNVGWFDRVNPSDECHRIPENKKIALWGLNDACDFFLQYQTNIVPDCIFDWDSSKSGTYSGIKVVLPDSIVDWEDYYIIIMCRDRYGLRDWLISKGMKETEDFLFYGYYVDRLSASEMMRKTIYALSKRKIDCAYPFNRAKLDSDGTMHLCPCGAMMVGDILQQNAEAAWNSVAASIARLSMINQTYSFCDKIACQSFVLEKIPILAGNVDESAYGRRASEMPKEIQMNSSITCNLYCETCRKERIYNSCVQDQRSMEIAKKAIPLIKNGNYVGTSGSGEVFLDASYQYVLSKMEEINHEDLKWEILTNGNLMTKEKVDYILKYGRNKIEIIAVSVDAARKETYLKIRRGGNWEKLIENLRYVGQQRKEGRFATFRLNFVVQSGNVKEMGEFVQLAESIGANKVWFTKVRNWGTYSTDEFKRIDVLDENGNIKSDYRIYFENPVLKSPIVDMEALLTGRNVYAD
ncbi:MAG TPA: hypothetical protein DCZ40_01710 [Lachnospiraceae bacterium]|nr:hypothetical protein [Lachnospiraceae bacterium]